MEVVLKVESDGINLAAAFEGKKITVTGEMLALGVDGFTQESFG